MEQGARRCGASRSQGGERRSSAAAKGKPPNCCNSLAARRVSKNTAPICVQSNREPAETQDFLPLNFKNHQEVLMPTKKLNTIDADTLQDHRLRAAHLPCGGSAAPGTAPVGRRAEDRQVLAGAVAVSPGGAGEPLWNFPTHPCEVLYLCLEDSFQRIQSRLFDLTEDAPPTLYFAVMAEQLHKRAGGTDRAVPQGASGHRARGHRHAAAHPHREQ